MFQSHKHNIQYTIHDICTVCNGIERLTIGKLKEDPVALICHKMPCIWITTNESNALVFGILLDKRLQRWYAIGKMVKYRVTSNDVYAKALYIH